MLLGVRYVFPGFCEGVSCFFCQVRLGVYEAFVKKQRERTKTKQEQTTEETQPHSLFYKKQGDLTKHVAKHSYSEVRPASSDVACL